ncbi:MAG: hypothetical protein N3G18_09900 [Candidatus Saccharicenans sp.]|nr:hypothetical protein [Candidatus Saccharicenans sp.]
MKLITYNLDGWQKELNAALDGLRRIDFTRRLLQKDHTLWKEKDLEISSRLGWLDSPQRMAPLLQDYRRQAEKVRQAGINLLVLLGMGGSSLAPEAISRIIGQVQGWPRLLMLDSTCPAAVRQVAQVAEDRSSRPLFLISSKSGTTSETLSLLNYFYHRQQEIHGPGAGKNFVAITDPGTPLENLAKQLGFSLTVNGFPDVGGRFSALSPFGLFPAVLLGVDLEKFLEPASNSYRLLTREESPHPGLILGSLLGVMARAGRDKLTLLLPAQLRSLGRWLEQLIAESTGKEGKGILPVLENLPVAEESYGQDRLFVFYEPESRPDFFWQERLEKLKKSGWPIIHISINVEELAAHFYLWELATAVAGHFLGLNPFDQPDVELTKKKTRELLATGSPTSPDSSLTSDGEAHLAQQLKSFFEESHRRPEYLALLCFLSPEDNLDVALDNLARQLSEKFRLPCVWNYGPAYLHSTGQLFKGDGGRGKFLGLLNDDPVDLAIPSLPGSPALTASFRQLFQAQALADFAALKEKGREIMHLRFKGRPVETIFRLGEITRNI